MGEIRGNEATKEQRVKGAKEQTSMGVGVDGMDLKTGRGMWLKLHDEINI